MGKGEKRFEEHKEHKLRGKGIVISPQDILKALNKFAAILPVSGPEELTLPKTKVAVEKEKIEQEIEEDVQKAKKNSTTRSRNRKNKRKNYILT